MILMFKYNNYKYKIIEYIYRGTTDHEIVDFVFRN